MFETRLVDYLSCYLPFQNTCFYQNRSLLNDARRLAANKDVNALKELSMSEVCQFPHYKLLGPFHLYFYYVLISFIPAATKLIIEL